MKNIRNNFCTKDDVIRMDVCIDVLETYNKKINSVMVVLCDAINSITTLVNVLKWMVLYLGICIIFNEFRK